MAASSSSSISKVSLTPTQYGSGSYLNPSRLDLVKLHTVRNPPMSVIACRPIAGTLVQEIKQVPIGLLGHLHGTETVLNLYFRVKDEEVHGELSAIEYVWKDSDGKSAVVSLHCLDKKLVEQEQRVKDEEVQLAALHQERAEHLRYHDPEGVVAVDKRIGALIKKIAKGKDGLNKAKDELRLKEEKNADGQEVKVAPLADPNIDAALAAAMAVAYKELGRYEHGPSKKQQ